MFFLQEKVLHNIMPIFTFMGASIMRLDDAYSFRVIDKTVQMVIPPLIQVRRRRSRQTCPFYTSGVAITLVAPPPNRPSSFLMEAPPLTWWP